MSRTAKYAPEAIERLRAGDLTLEEVGNPNRSVLYDEALVLIECLLSYPNAVKKLHLDFIGLKDNAGVALAKYVETSSTIEVLGIIHNDFSEKTFLAFAAALKTNTSLKQFYITQPTLPDRCRVDAAFVAALRINPNRPVGSRWWIWNTVTFGPTDFDQLKHKAELMGPFSMLERLCACDRERKRMR